MTSPETVSEAEVEAAACAICPDWWGETVFDDFWQCQRHPLDNYSGQHVNYREKSLKQARAALTAAAQVREGAGQQNMIIGTLGTIANMSDEENEWDGTDKFHDAREMARTAMVHLPGAKESYVCCSWPDCGGSGGPGASGETRLVGECVCRRASTELSPLSGQVKVSDPTYEKGWKWAFPAAALGIRKGE